MSCAFFSRFSSLLRCAVGNARELSGTTVRLGTPGTQPETAGNDGALGTKLCDWERDRELFFPVSFQINFFSFQLFGSLNLQNTMQIQKEVTQGN